MLPGGTAEFATPTEAKTGSEYRPKANPGAYGSPQGYHPGSRAQGRKPTNVFFLGKNNGGVQMEELNGNLEMSSGPDGIRITSEGVTYTVDGWNAKLARDAQKSRERAE